MLVDTYVPSFFAGILLGVETSIPESVQEAFKETGTSHIIAIESGLYAQSCGRVLGLYRGALAALWLPSQSIQSWEAGMQLLYGPPSWVGSPWPQA